MGKQRAAAARGKGLVVSLRAAHSLLAAAVLLTAPSARAQTGVGDLIGRVEERHLDNGMTVLVQEDHRVPLVSLAIRYELGPGAVPLGREGTATVTSFLMLDRSQHLAPGEAGRLLTRAGASSRGDSAGPITLRQWVTLPAHQLALPLWVWSDQMGFFDAAVDDAAVASQRTRLLAIRTTALDGQALGRLDAIANQELFPETDPSRFGALQPADVEHVDRADVLAFHDAWITPDHATLAIVGDIGAAEAFALVTRYFGTIPRAPGRARPRWGTTPRLAGEAIVDVAANVPLAWASVRWRTPRELTADDAQLDVAARWFNGRDNSVLTWKLVDERKVATGLRVRQRSTIAGSEFEVTIQGAPGKTAAELVTALDASLDELRKVQPSTSALQAAAYETVIDRLTAKERTEARAIELGKFSAFLGAPGQLWQEADRYQAITAPEVHSAVVRWLVPDRRVVVRVTPAPTASRGGDVLKRTFAPARTP